MPRAVAAAPDAAARVLVALAAGLARQVATAAADGGPAARADAAAQWVADTRLAVGASVWPVRAHGANGAGAVNGVGRGGRERC
jgi:hypothetical protein